MKQINIREALLELDRKTDARYDLTTLYEACKLDDDDKQQLVKYIDAYDHPATINKFLSSKCSAITEALGDDDVSDMKIIDEINDGGDRTLWSLMDKVDDEDLQLKDLKEDIDPEVLQGRLDSIDYVMNHYVKDSFLIDDVQGSGKEWKVTYNDVTVDVTFDTDWEEYTYYINGKGPYAHSSYEYIASDIANFVDYNHLGQSDDEVDESLTEDVDTSNLEPQIKEVVNAVMQENGYEADEIEAYTAVEIKDTVDDMVQVEVRAELGYDDLMELCDKLNPIVAAIDHRAYFEPVTSGIARAFIRNDQSQDIVDEEAVNQWTNKIYDCASMEDLRQVWTAFKDHIDNGQYTDGTVDAVLDEIHKKADILNESLTEGYNKGDWVEVNLNTKKNGTPNIIPVKVEKELYHGNTFLGWAWGERQHEYPMSAIVKKIDMDDTDAIIKKYTPSGYMSEKLTLNESDDTDILYDMEDYDEDNTTVTAGNSFIEDGHTWTWFRQCGDTVHLDFDNWAVWWAYRPEVEDDYDSTAISGFFVVDTDTGFIDWGPCDTVKEAQEFLQSKVNDWENDNIDESKPVKESYRQDTPDNVYKVGDRVAQRWTDEFNVGTVTDIKEEEGTQYKVEWDYSEGPSVEWLYGTDISLWIEEENIDESKSIKEELFRYPNTGSEVVGHLITVAGVCVDAVRDSVFDCKSINLCVPSDDTDSKEWLESQGYHKRLNHSGETYYTKDGIIIALDTSIGCLYDAVPAEDSASVEAYQKLLSKHNIRVNEIRVCSGEDERDYFEGPESNDEVEGSKFLDKFPFVGMDESYEEWTTLEFALAEYYYLNPSKQRYVEHSWRAPNVDDAAQAAADEAGNGSGEMSDGQHWTEFITDFNTLNEYRGYVKELVQRAEELNTKVDLANLEALNSEGFNESKSINESADTMIYLFPELTDEDLDAAKGYGLQFLGKNHGPDGSEDNWVLKGYESSLKMFADKYLGYELHPDYLYNEEDFAGDIINESLNEDVSSAASSLFDLLKDYGAISVDKDIDVTRISFRNSEDDSDATLVHHCILSKGYKEINQFGSNPNVTEYINEAGDTCVKLLIYDDSIAVELSAEDSSQYMESVDKDLTHCTECGKKLNDKGYCETEGCPNGTLKEGVEDENIIAKKSNGDYLIRANSGWGYTAFNAAGACIGGITTDDEEEAKNKFMSGKLDEGFFGDVGKTIKAAGKEIADKTGISKVTKPVVDKAKEVAGKVKQKIDNTEAAKTFKDTETYKRMQDAKEVRGVIANIKAARSKEDIEKALAEIKALQKSGKLHTDGHMPYLMDLYKQRKRQLGLKVKKREGLEETDWSDDELADIYGGDTKYDMPDGVETPEETEARLAKENALTESSNLQKDLKEWATEIATCIFNIVNNGNIPTISTVSTGVDISKVRGEDYVKATFRVDGSAKKVVSECQTDAQVIELIDQCPYEVRIDDNEHYVKQYVVGLDEVVVSVYSEQENTTIENQPQPSFDVVEGISADKLYDVLYNCVLQVNDSLRGGQKLSANSAVNNAYMYFKDYADDEGWKYSSKSIKALLQYLINTEFTW